MPRTSPIEIAGKELLLRQWVRRELGSSFHEERVARVAQHLFDLTRPWHGLGAAERKLLTLGALLHDVGRAAGSKGHAERGAAMILVSRSLPLGEAERRRLAYLARYHRGRVPEAREQHILDAERGDNVERMQMILGLLRAADALDSRELGTPRLVFALRERTLTICVYVRGDMAEARRTYARPKKLRLLEKTLNCHIRTEWFSTESLALVA